MTEATPPTVVGSYLGQLETELLGVPEDVRREILAGIVEELSGLDAAAAAARVKELGDPAFIAAEARAETGAAPAPGPAASGDPRWYTVLASLLVALGGVVIPVLGWVFGIAMVWVAKSWRRWEKWVATLAPVLAIAIAALTLWLLRPGAATPEGMMSGGMTSGNPPSPLMPTLFDMWWFGFFLVAGLNLLVGVWLLWRGLCRPAEPYAQAGSPLVSRTP